MKNLKLLSFIFALACFVTSCAAFRVADLSKVSIGMDKQSVIAILNKPDQVVGARQYPTGNIEVLAYIQGMDTNSKAYYKWLYFYKDRLVEISTPGNWQRDADMIVADNSGNQ